MFKNLGLRWKIMVLLVVVVPVLIGITLYMTNSFIGQMTTSAEKQSIEMAYRYANKIDTDMSLAITAARTLALHTVPMLDGTGKISRETLVANMQHFLRDHKELLGVFYVLEPNVLDGKDAEYSGADYHNADGRFVPWVSYNGSQLFTQASVGYDVDNPDGAYYFGPKKSGQEFIVEPWAYDIAGKNVFMVDFVVPMKKDGQFKGVVGIDFPMGTIDEFVTKIKIFETGYAFLLSNAGTFIAHPNSKKFVDGKVNIFDYPKATPELKAGLKRVLKGDDFSIYIEEDGKTALFTFVPIFIGRSKDPFILGLKTPMDEVLAEANSMRTTALGISGVAILVLMLIILAVARAITRPIQSTVQAVEAISSGDLSVKLSADSKDEVGRMQVAVNEMATELSRNLDEINTQKAAAEEKTRLAEVATQEAEEARLQAERAKAEGMLAAAERLEQIIGHVSGASEEISAQNNDIRGGTEVQRDRIASTATAMEEMNATVLEVARNATETAHQAEESRNSALEGAKVVSESVTAMDFIQKEASGLKESMSQLGEQAEAIGTIMNVIEDIADQTNLLALNAAIEAARAGEAGRGFAVVADEVRKLAEKTMGATKEVGDSIRSIQDGARNNISAMDATAGRIAEATELSIRSGEMLREIVEGVELSADRVQSIATAAEQQAATSEEINQSVEEINSITLETAQAVNEAAAAAEGLAKQAQELDLIIQDMKNQG